MPQPRLFVAFVLFLVASGASRGWSQEPAGGPARGSFIEDRAAKKLIEAGDARVESDEVAKAIEIWKSVIERYPRSKVRYTAHMRLGNHFLERERAYDRARTHFEAASAVENSDEEQRSDATLKMGICFYHDRNYGKCFQVMRSVIENFPVSAQVNEAYYYIGLGHYQLGHYSRAIAALENVGTTLAGEQGKVEKLEAGKRFFVKIEDADLAVLDPGEAVEVQCQVASGDVEKVLCYPVGRNVRVVLGSIPSKLGVPQAGNGTLEVKGGDSIKVTYTDSHTADKKLNNPVIKDVQVVGNAIVAVTDGAFAETIRGVVLGKSVNIRVTDADRDVSDNADELKALVEIIRPKTTEELEAEATAAAAKAKEAGAPPPSEDGEGPSIERYKLIDRVEVTFKETKEAAPIVEQKSEDPNQPAAAPAAEAPVNNTIHSGVFHAVVGMVKADTAVPNDDTLQALPGDEVRVTYLDDRHTAEGVRNVVYKAKCLEGNIGGVRVTKAVITDQELRIQTKLKTSEALTQIANRYKEFGLKSKATEKYQQALDVCEEIMDEARKVGGHLLEATYVQLWQIYFQMDNIGLAAAMCQRLQREFPSSGFVDDALLQLGEVARKEKGYERAIGIFSQIVNMQTSQLRGEAQFGIAQCYEDMASAAKGVTSTQLQDRAFQEYKRVFEQFPESGRVGEAVAKMANYYYQQQDYARAVDVFESVLNDHPDAKFLDVILFNYGRCLYRMGRKADARRRFDQLIGDYPESPLATDAKKISEALAKAGF